MTNFASRTKLLIGASFLIDRIMDADGIPMVGQSIDLFRLEPLQHKRILAYVNHFFIQMTSMINRFGGKAEVKLMLLDDRILQLQTTLQLLEAKIASIPGLTEVVDTAADTTKTADVPPAQDAAPPSNTCTEAEQAHVPDAPEPAEQPAYTPVSQDPRYSKYFKMVNMGVPPAALHTKMKLEGLDPLYLDNPDQPAPPMDTATGDSTEDTGSSYSSD